MSIETANAANHSAYLTPAGITTVEPIKDGFKEGVEFALYKANTQLTPILDEALDTMGKTKIIIEEQLKSEMFINKREVWSLLICGLEKSINNIKALKG